MKKMAIIITMAGLGSRFKRAGYSVPKYMIEAKGKTLFEWSMDSLIGYNENVYKYIFIVQEKDGTDNFIYEKMKKYNIPSIEIVKIKEPTDGQATTCMLAIPHCIMNYPIMVYNIDTYVEPNELKYQDISGDGHIPCFNADGDHWSFVSIDDSNRAIEVKEKERISNNCSLGAYYFSSAKLYEKIYNEYYANSNNSINGEKYIAPLYNYLIENGEKVTICIVDPSKVHVLGTPEELKLFIDQ